jgi:6,7-dimethyl-8-ribityllumazine synthase
MIIIVTANFNSIITDQLQASAVEVLKKAGEKYEIIRVPGAVELPITVQYQIRHKKPKVVIALGCVIKGDTDHYNFVLRSCIDGLGRVSLDEGVPVIQGVLACYKFSDAWNRRTLGKDYAETALWMKELIS